MTIRFKIFKRACSRNSDAIFSNVYVRIRDGRTVDQTVRTEILVSGNCWDEKHECVKAKASYPLKQRATVDASVQKLKAHISTSYVADKLDGKIGDSWLQNCVKAYYNIQAETSLDKILEAFLEDRELSVQRQRQYKSLMNIIAKYEAYASLVRKAKYRFNIFKIDDKDLNQFVHFLTMEHELCKQYPEMLKTFYGGKQPRPRGRNTTNDLMKKLRAIFAWCVSEGYLSASPFDSFHIPQELYGTPVCLTTDELKKIANANFSMRKRLAVQRDIFVFQCNVGCRVSDLVKLKKADVIDGTISYIPTKTIKDNPRTVVVPLNRMALEVAQRYADLPQEELLPFISVQRYNDNIKKILEICGIKREVTVLDPLTRKAKKVRICDVASSHLARRTFINNIYKHVKDQALVASLTGHVEGSRAFCRYRDIDNSVKRELVGFLDE